MRTSPPLVSIVVPVFNGERYLRESLDTILAQNYPNTEVLLMDDGSSDSTPEIAAGYGNRIRYHRQATNLGIYANCNTGIELARGEYIAIYHSDDLYDPRIVEREVEFLEQYPEAGAVFTKDIFIDASGRQFGKLELPPEIPGGRPLGYNIIFNGILKNLNRFLPCPSSMVRTSIYRELGGYRQDVFRNSSDLDMWLRIARRHPIGVIDDFLFRYRFGHGNSAQRYHSLRSDPNRTFVIMDTFLAEGDRSVATKDSLKHYEAHRAEDNLIRSTAAYIKTGPSDARPVLAQVKTAKLIGSSQVQRWRLLLLYLVLRIVYLLPRIKLVADLMFRRWHAKKFIGRGEPLQPFPAACVKQFSRT